jgi:hypothetical protein
VRPVSLGTRLRGEDGRQPSSRIVRWTRWTAVARLVRHPRRPPFAGEPRLASTRELARLPLQREPTALSAPLEGHFAAPRAGGKWQHRCLGPQAGSDIGDIRQGRRIRPNRARSGPPIYVDDAVCNERQLGGTGVLIVARPEAIPWQRESGRTARDFEVSDPVTRAQSPVGGHSALACGTSPVAIEHLPAAPAGQTHEVAFAATAGKPPVGERVA